VCLCGYAGGICGTDRGVEMIGILLVSGI
jgi:hypothetical protein